MAPRRLQQGYEGVLLSIEKLIEEHRENCDSRLKEIVPSVGEGVLYFVFSDIVPFHALAAKIITCHHCTSLRVVATSTSLPLVSVAAPPTAFAIAVGYVETLTFGGAPQALFGRPCLSGTPSCATTRLHI